ncbi:hypothetical protein H5410_001636 [Solanum commersonii]|uniref:Isopentenyltransferase n=1 Tax=Solanum commersonii TaxID=4109 RepID=A0A9J6B0N1_SOLCO|nr:hypothetical protein H5410_001636 [Solanum commersonii]
MARYLREEKNIDGDDESKKMILQSSISNIERNIRILICNKLDKIQRLINEKMSLVYHIIATNVFKEDRKEVVDEAWRNTVWKPCLDITQCVPIIVGGSNSYIEKLVEDTVFMLKYKYDSCFIWIDVEQSVLNRRVDTRVDELDNANYTKGIRWSIGVPEMTRYLREEKNIDGDDESKKMILQASISSIKRNTPKMNTFINNKNKFNKKKVVFIMGATGTGKSRLSVDLATHFRREILNLDKIQVYKGPGSVTNKITHTEKQGVRHYLLGEIESDSDFTAEDFFLKSIVNIEFFLKTQCVPIIGGGSNSYIEKLVEDPVFMFKYKYESCFIWIDVEQSILNRRVDTKVDKMVNAGWWMRCGNLSFQMQITPKEFDDGDDESKKMILQDSISSIKRSTCILILTNLTRFND